MYNEHQTNRSLHRSKSFRILKYGRPLGVLPLLVGKTISTRSAPKPKIIGSDLNARQFRRNGVIS
ncbi:hypothetical protein BD779DRAFT_1497990 [Infundibulicybe gibba]|nr:hypothetical protein BD779DRAFT_1497990 [Infundibulicybe gibba]